jgi:uncharacterized protein YfaS (alpha-2-macroglobulin family)
MADSEMAAQAAPIAGKSSSAKKWIGMALILIAIVFAGYSIYMFNIDKHINEQNTVIIGQDTLSPGEQASFRVVALNYKNQEPLANADVVLTAEPKDSGAGKSVTFTGRTTADGTLDVKFTTPELANGQTEADYELKITTKSDVGKDSFTRMIKLERAYKILLTTDKPLYQPGQTISIRALALSTISSKPAKNSDITIEVEDAKGNKVFKKIIKSSEYGIVGTNFTLADEINQGLYTIRATLNGYSSEKKVTVSRYVLPKFKVSLATDKTYYMPGQSLKGTLNSNYFFGKPVTNSRVNVKIYTYEINMRQIGEVQGRTDISGNFYFDFNLPSYFVGIPLEKGSSLLFFNITVTDQADHAESLTESVPIANSPLLVEIIPESGVLENGVENVIYIVTSYPDGKPAQASLKISGVDGKTNKLGIGEYRVTPQGYSLNIMVTATDQDDNKGSKQLQLPIHQSSSTFDSLSGKTTLQESVLIRTDKSLYEVGESAQIEVLYNNKKGTVYVDVIKDGQTILTKAVDVTGSRASLSLDLDESMTGTLELHAYKILGTSDIVRDTKTIVVNPRKDIDLSISLDKDTYKPGDSAVLSFQTQKQGMAIPSAIGVNIVDESVFALQEKEAGFEKYYFSLEKELMQPKVTIYGVTLPEMMYGGAIPEPDLRKEAGNVLLAQAPNVDRFDIKSFSYPEKKKMLEDAKKKYFTGAAKVLYYLILLIPILLVVLTICSHKHAKKELLKNFALSIPIAFGLLIVGVGIIVGLGFIMSMISVMFYRLGISEVVILGFFSIIPLAAIICLILVIRHTIKEKEFFFWDSLLYVAFIVLIAIWIAIIAIVRIDFENIVGTKLSWIALFIIFLPNIMIIYALESFRNKKKIGIAALIIALLCLAPFVGVFGYFGVLSPSRMMASSAKLGGMIDNNMMEEGAAVPGATSGSDKPRVRSFFPETLYTNPQIITDDSGKAKVNLQVADSITTWRISALASSLNGDMGSANKGMRVFQDFFVDIDLPVSLTQNDEVSIPIAVYNYLPLSQDVRLEVVQEPWFDLLDSSVKTITIGMDDVDVVYFTIKAKQIGVQKLTVYAYGSKLNDAISRSIEIVPDGFEIRNSDSDKLDKTIEREITIPQEAIDNSEKLFVKIYPGIFSQVVEGLDSMLQMPYGCFEQTSSITYPNVLALDYMKSTKQITPEIQFKAEQYIGVGYQRLMSFETSTPGGFDWYGNSPPKLLLTAFGLQEFSDMAKVYNVDEKLVPRVQKWLKSQQNSDGSWEPKDSLHATSRLTGSKMTATCYVAWSLLYSGEKNLGNAINYIKNNINYGEGTDSYTIAICANALAAYDKNDVATEQALGTLDSRKKELNDTIYWESQGNFREYDRATVMGGVAEMKDLETTALAAIAYMKADYKPRDVDKILKHIVQQKSSFGNWGSTQATILSLKAMIDSITKSSEKPDATVKVYANGIEAASLRINKDNGDVLNLIDLKPYAKEGTNKVKLTISGEGNLFYQIVSAYYLPWQDNRVASIISDNKLISLDVKYDKTLLKKDDLVTVNVAAKFNGPGIANFVVIDLGIPPGFTVLPEGLDMMKSRGLIKKYDITGRQIIIYVENLNSNGVAFSYQIKPRYPIKAKIPASKAYDYYNPSVVDEVAASEVFVNW